jgi:hypothetical protein
MYSHSRHYQIAGRALLATLLVALTVSVQRTPVTADPDGPLTLTLNGSANYHVEYKLANYAEPGATVSGGAQPYSTVAITGAVNSGVPGSYTLNYSVTDANGNVASASRTVTVADTIAPTVNAVVNTDKFTHPNCVMTNMGLGASIHDAADSKPNVQVYLFSDEDDRDQCLITGSTSSSHSPDGAFGPDVPGRYRSEYARTLARYQVRNECEPQAAGRVYVALVVAYDDAGNMGYDTATVVVENPESTGISSTEEAQVVSQRVDEFAINAMGGALPAGFYKIGEQTGRTITR